MTKKRMALALKFAVSGGFLWYLAGKVELGAAVQRIGQLDPVMLAAAALILLLQMVIGGARWQVTIDGIGARLAFQRTVLFFYMGNFFNQVLPSTLGGDAVRAYKAHRAGLGLGAAINGVMLERVGTVLALILLVIAVQPASWPRVGDTLGAWLGGTALALLLAAIVGLGILMNLDRLPAAARRWRVFEGLAALAEDSRRVFLSPASVFLLLALGVAGHVNLTAGVYLLARGLDLEVTLVDCLALFPPILLVITLPISIAGWGVREGAMVAAFGLVGVSEEGTLALSLVIGLLGAATAVPGGLLWLASGERGTRGAEETRPDAAATRPGDG